MEAPDGALTMSTQGKYVILQATDNCEMYTSISLKLTVFDKDGNEIWSQNHDMSYKDHHYRMTLEKISSSPDSVKAIMSVYGPDPNVKVPVLTVLVNSKYLCHIEYTAGNMGNYAIKVIDIPRDYNNDLYQIKIQTTKYCDTWQFSADELFSPIEQEQ